jgi:thiol-disulfide isomerase/thioredoxin
MIRLVSYPIARLFTSIAIGLMLLGVQDNARAGDTGEVVGFEDQAGKTFFLHDFKGKPVIVNLWATWCEPCIKEMPSIDKLQNDYAAKGLVVLTLCEDDTLADALDFFKKHNITHLTPYLDKGHGVWTAIQARGIPTTVLINTNGVMVQRIEGPVDWQALQLQPILNQIVK